MVVKGNTKRLIIGLWVLAALLILWYNAAAMTSLFDQPLAGLSPDARATIAKWQRLENRLSTQLEAVFDPGEIEKIVARVDFKKPPAPLKTQKNRASRKVDNQASPVPEKEVKLPDLSGILGLYGTNGRVDYLAVINGQTHAENSSVGDFVIEKIEARGVLLTQGRRSWYIAAPQVDFSMSAADRVTGSETR